MFTLLRATNRLYPAFARFSKLAVLWISFFGVQLVAADRVEFNRDIRPILSDHCFACHGPDKNTRETEMRLDTEAGLFGEGESSPVIRGDVEGSELMHRITVEDEDERMPPPEFGKDLQPEQVELLRRWIEQGAVWQGHWSFQPIRRPELPPNESFSDFKNPIDTFVAARLESEGLRLSPLADRRTLARRLHFDLLGLPASPEVVERFVADTHPMAYENLVDELLASPHFGERMAMWWLDLVRYADSVGYHGDQPVSVSPFRDYVIDSFNRNKPFDQFTIEQIAGDLMPEPSIEQQIAAGYNRLGMMSAEGGVQPKEYLAKYIAERVRNLGGTWLGVTLGCCECHDHKYDPFSAQDFYQFEAFFADIEERGLYGGNDWGPKIDVPTAEQLARLADFDEKIAEVRQRLAAPTDALAEAQRLWESDQSSWQLLEPTRLESTNGTTLVMQESGSILASGDSPDTDVYTLTFEEWPATLTALRLEVLPHESLPKHGPGRAGNGNFVVSEFEVNLVEGQHKHPVQLQNATATYEQTGAAGGHPDKKWTAASAIDGDEQGEKWGWAVMEQVGKPNSAVFELAPESIAQAQSKLESEVDLNGEESGSSGGLTSGENATGEQTTLRALQIVLRQSLDNPRHTLGHFRIYTTDETRPVTASQLLPVEIQGLLAISAESRTEEQGQQLASYYRDIAPALEPDRQRLKQLEDERKKYNQTIPTMLVTKTVKPRMVRVLARGNWMDDSGVVVRPAIPQLLGGTELQDDQRLTRMDLAQWVVSPENPLTARVSMNRLWRLFFGIGLSSKLDDLGAQGEWPSHPELLDWLAAEFRSSGWNVKAMLKLMVMSEAYQQSSFAPPEMMNRDPYNRLIARQGRWRLNAEVVRDTLLTCSGLLIDTIGGESVKPYQPAGYWAYLNFPAREWANGKGSELYRRGVYTHWQRQYLHPSLLAFDAPSREECTADRSRSNTPLQALVLLNDPTYVEAARALAVRILKSEETDEGRIRWAVRETLARSPRDAELPVLVDLLAKHRREYTANTEAAEKLFSVGNSPVPEDVDAVELAAWASVARTLLNLHETITRN